MTDLDEQLGRLGVQLLSIPAPTGDEKLRLEGWRDGIEKYGQELWRIYHWIVACQGGNTHGIYALRDWLESFNVPDGNTPTPKPPRNRGEAVGVNGLAALGERDDA